MDRLRWRPTPEGAIYWEQLIDDPFDRFEVLFSWMEESDVWRAADGEYNIPKWWEAVW